MTHMFSGRTSWPRQLLPLARLAAEKHARGVPIIDLTTSNPTRCGLTFPADLLDSCFPREQLDFYEPRPEGLEPARQAIAALYGAAGARIPADRVFLTAGTSEAYSHLFRLLCNAGDRILTPQPGYPLLDYLADLSDVLPDPYTLNHAGEWCIDLNALRNTVTDRTRAIILVHPHHPTGSYVKDHERRELVALAREKGLALIADEVFWWYPLNGTEPAEKSFAGEPEAVVFTVNGISKLLGLPQWKLGWITVSGPEDLCREAAGRLEVILDAYLSVNTPIQSALPAVLSRRSQRTGPILDRVCRNIRQLRSTLSADGDVSLLDAEGGWTAVLRLPSMKSGQEWSREFLERESVLVHPGELYGWERESIAVVSLLVEPAMLRAGVGALLGVVQAGVAGRSQGLSAGGQKA